MKNATIHIFIGLFLFAAAAQSQWLASISSYAAYDDNIFGTYREKGDFYTAPGLYLSNIAENTEWYYDGTLLQLRENSHYNYSSHKLGMNFYPEISIPRSTLDIGGSYSLRLNRDDYIYRNYSQLYAYVSLKSYTAANMLSRLRIIYRQKTFPDEYSWNLPWDHREFSLYLQHNIFLQTGTTLRAGLQGMLRDFMPYSGYFDGTITSGELPSLNQSVFTLRVAQALSGNFGGYTEYLYRYNPSESNPYEPEIMSFSPIDDYFGYGEQSWRLNLKYKITPGLSISSSVKVYERSYKNRPVFAYDFISRSFVTDENGYYISKGYSRDDSGYILNTGIDFHLARLFEQASSLSLRFDYDLRSNNSNDPYYEYLKQSYAMQLSWSFQK